MFSFQKDSPVNTIQVSLPPSRRAFKAVKRRLAWIRSGLFWRTFFLLGFLILISMMAWVASFRMVERTPLAQQMAAQVVSIVTITRAALTHSAPDLRRELLFDLASNEGVRIYPLEDNDKVEPVPENEMMAQLRQSVRARLGGDTKFANSVNDVPGFWVSFKIDDDDEYWLMLEREKLERASGLQWVGWAAVVAVISILGAAFLSGLINQPLSRLATAARSLAKGEHPPPLPETGPKEIRQANRSFNQMVDDLQQVESDRAVFLAGISHDLRTPLARMRLEIEMANLSDLSRDGMQSDIAQMDAIIGQFLDYAKPINSAGFTAIDLSLLVADAVHDANRLPDVKVTPSIAPHVLVMGNATDLRRILNNLVENARRYGKTASNGIAELDISCVGEGDYAVVEVADHGQGVPEADIPRLLRPFTRLEVARSQANGAGLGLAIVDRVTKVHGGKLELKNREGGGLRIRLRLPILSKSQLSELIAQSQAAADQNEGAAQPSGN